MEAIILKKGVFLNNDINCTSIRKTIMQIKMNKPLRDPEKKISIEYRVSNKSMSKTLAIDFVFVIM